MNTRNRPPLRPLLAAAATAAAAAAAGCAALSAPKAAPAADEQASMKTPPPLVVLSDSTGAKAAVAPSLGGRVLSFVPSGAPGNLLWNGPAAPMSGWRNHGGEKTWIGPQNLWPSVNGGTSWPPPFFFDQTPFSSDPAAPAESAAVSMRSADPGDCACPFAVARRVSLEGGVLAIEENLVPRADGRSPKAGKGLAPLPDGDDGWHVWSVTQVPYGKRVAIRTGEPWRFDGPGGDGFPLRQVSADGAIRVLEIGNDEKRGKIFFDGDAIAVEYPEGSLVARRVPAEDDIHGPAFTRHAPAQLFTGYHDDPVNLRYLELEFTAVGRRTLRVELSFVPGRNCLEALKRL